MKARAFEREGPYNLSMDLVMMQSAVEQVDHEVAALSGGMSGVPALRTAWARLVTVLDLGPRRAMRDCPRCGKAGMREATLCGYCWLRLVPPGADVTEALRSTS